MRHFPFKILILCVLLPPLAYVYSLQLLEGAIQARYTRDLAASYIGDTRLLFDGSIRLQDAMRENINAFIDTRKLIRWGLRVRITVKSQDGIYLYPDGYDDPKSELRPTDSLAIARENYSLLTEGLIREVEVKVEHNTWLSNAILAFYIAVSLLVLFSFYRRGEKRSWEEETAKQEMIEDLAKDRQESLEKLQRLEDQRINLGKKIASMNRELEHERQKALATEDEMVEELVALEEKLGDNLIQREQQLQEIDGLKEKISLLEKEKQTKNRQLLKGIAAARKRFTALYKKIAFHDRAVEGFADLTEEMKIKAEEVIHQLNDDPKLIQIKRKVFGKKNRETVFEVIFGYKGRLYFRNIPGNRVEILTIGTKLTQNKDLAFLDKLQPAG
jgi:hypothetical protein